MKLNAKFGIKNRFQHRSKGEAFLRIKYRSRKRVKNYYDIRDVLQLILTLLERVNSLTQTLEFGPYMTIA